MLVYIAVFAGVSSVVVLAAVYLADRYEREPLELIQDAFLLGAAVQLILTLAARAILGSDVWSSGLMILTAALSALWLPFHLARLDEADERFDGIVYSVAAVAGASCVIHVGNLPGLIAGSPYADALTGAAAPSLRDLLIVISWPEFGRELARHLGLIGAAVLAGALAGIRHAAGRPRGVSALLAALLATAATGLVWASGDEVWPVIVVVAVAIVWAAWIKRRSVHRGAPEAPEDALLVRVVKTVALVLGIALAASAVLQTVPTVSHPAASPVPSDSGHLSGGER